MSHRPPLLPHESHSTRSTKLTALFSIFLLCILQQTHQLEIRQSLVVLVRSFQQSFLRSSFTQRHLLCSSFFLSLVLPISTTFETFLPLHPTHSIFCSWTTIISLFEIPDAAYLQSIVTLHFQSRPVLTIGKHAHAFTFAMATSYASGLDISSWNYNDHTNLQIPLGINCMVSIILVLMLILLRLCVRFSNGTLGHDDCKLHICFLATSGAAELPAFQQPNQTPLVMI